MNETTFTPIDEIIQREGEAEGAILVNPTRGEEPIGVILNYRSRGFLIVNGMQVPIDKICAVSFNNAAIPQLPNDYQIVIRTTLPDKEFIHLPVGNDIGWARSVCEQIRAAVE